MITYEDGLKLELPDLMATQAFASAVSKVLVPGLCIYLEGDLGAGKTTFVRGVLTTLGHNATIKSPTFTLVETYNFDAMDVYHFDLYRLADPSELEYIGVRDYLLENAVCFFEWADKGLGQIPIADLAIKLCINNNMGRTAVMNANSKRGLKMLQDLAAGMS